MAPEPLSLDDALAERDAVLDLIAGDVIHEPSNRAVAEAILRAGREHPDGFVDCNSIRPYLPAWINPRCIGATFHRLATKRVALIERVEGVFVLNSDRKSRNVGKPMPQWRLTPRAYQETAA